MLRVSGRSDHNHFALVYSLVAGKFERVMHTQFIQESSCGEKLAPKKAKAHIGKIYVPSGVLLAPIASKTSVNY